MTAYCNPRRCRVYLIIISDCNITLIFYFVNKEINMSNNVSSSDISSSDSDDTINEVLELLSDLESSSEDEVRRASSRTLRRVNYMQSLDDADFIFKFRLSKSTVNVLLAEIMPFVRVTSSRNYGVSPLHQLLLTLRFYALGTMLISVADFVGVSISTAGRIVYDISSAIGNIYNKHVKVHQESADKFYNIGGFPRVFAAIDCTHIRIQSPCHIKKEYRNRKGYFSLNVQAICDADMQFMNVVAHWPGSSHDATIFNNSVLRANCDAGQYGNQWMLGDSAYPNRPYLLTPVPNPTSEAEQRYNQAHAKTRNVIERTFEVWRRRFPAIVLPLRLSLPKVQAIIIATAVLHNICIKFNLEEVPEEMEVPTYDMEDNDDSTETGDITERTRLINNYFTK